MTVFTPDFFQKQNQTIAHQLVALRRDFHQHPELAFEEYRTSEKIKEYLHSIGIQRIKEGVAKTGITGYLGKEGGPTIALRADMDALPIQEKNKVPYRSKHAGVMHACGHDFHMASLLGTLTILKEIEKHLPGQVKFVFQPSEEKLPGGASVMIQDGVLNDVQAIVGQHAMPLLDTGVIGIREGTYMASTDEIYITIHGKGGHGAQPHTTTDPVTIMATLITTLQQIVSRKSDPRIPSVLSFGKVIANGATNVIPDKVYIEGTFRTFDEQWRAEAHELIRKISTQIGKGLGAKVNVTIQKGYPVLVNHPSLTRFVKQKAIQYVGKDKVVDLPLWTASEDFAYYTQVKPGTFYRMGTRNQGKNIVHHLHTPHFDIDEDVLSIAPGFMAYLAYSYLHETPLAS